MACDIYASGRVMLVVWGRPQLRDLARIDRRAREVYDQWGPLIFIARVPAQAAAPDEHTRAQMAKLLEHFTERCLTYHAVFEGTGFFVAAKRTALATMFLMTGKRNKHYVHSTCDEVARAVPPEFRAELRAALGEFRSRGMLDYSLKSLRPPAGQDAEVR